MPLYGAQGLVGRKIEELGRERLPGRVCADVFAYVIEDIERVLEGLPEEGPHERRPCLKA